MKCQSCGAELPNSNSKCKYCGNVTKALEVTKFEKIEETVKEEPKKTNPNVKIIDPDSVTIGKKGSERQSFGGGGFGGIFGSLFGGVFDSFDPFGDYYEDEDDDEPDNGFNRVLVDDFGNPLPRDVFDRDFVEVKEIDQIPVDDSSDEKKKTSFQDKFQEGIKKIFKKDKKDE